MTDTIRFTVRFVAVFVLLAQFTYRAGYATGRFVAHASDWLANATHRPMETAISVATRSVAWAESILAEPTDLLTLLNAQVLTDDDLEAEIRAYDEAQRKKPARTTARRKPATARKARAKVAAA